MTGHNFIKLFFHSSDPNNSMGLFNESLTMRSMNMIEKGLDTAMLRREVIANNIANVDVPHFKRSEVAFEAELKRAVESERTIDEEQPLQTLHPEHIARPKARDYRDVAAAIHTDYNSSMRNDGNNVDIESEVSDLNRNQMMFNLLTDRIGANFRMLNYLSRMA